MKLKVICLTTVIFCTSASAESIEKLRYPANFDFRQSPAFVRFGNSVKQIADAEKMTFKNCPQQALLVSKRKQSSGLFDQEQVRHKIIHASMPNLKKPGKEYREIFATKVKADPILQKIIAQRNQLDSEIEKLEEAIEPCAEKIAKESSLTIPLFKDEKLTDQEGFLRIQLAQTPNDSPILEYRHHKEVTWTEFKGDFIPAGEWGYAYNTVLEKKGNLVKLPRDPFSQTVWFDFVKAYGNSFGEDLERDLIVFAPEKDDSAYLWYDKFGDSPIVPIRIDGTDAILRVDNKKILDEDSKGEYSEKLERLKKTGQEVRIPLKDFFDQKEHLNIVALGC